MCVFQYYLSSDNSWTEVIFLYFKPLPTFQTDLWVRGFPPPPKLKSTLHPLFLPLPLFVAGNYPSDFWEPLLFVWVGVAAGCYFAGYLMCIILCWEMTNETTVHVRSRFCASGKWRIYWMWKDWTVECVSIQHQTLCVDATVKYVPLPNLEIAGRNAEAQPSSEHLQIQFWQ